MTHTTAQKVRMRLQAIVDRLSEKAAHDQRIMSNVGQSQTSHTWQARVRDEYRNAVRNEFPGCTVVFQWGRIKVFPPDGYMDQRGSVGAPISPMLMSALFYGIQVSK